MADPDTCRYTCTPDIWTNNSIITGNVENDCCGDDNNEGRPYLNYEDTPHPSCPNGNCCADGNDNDCDGNIDQFDSDCSNICSNSGEDDFTVPGENCNQCNLPGDQFNNQRSTITNQSWNDLHPAYLEYADTCDLRCNPAIGGAKTVTADQFEGPTELSCGDGINNDCDEFYDCYDSDCDGDVLCNPGPPEEPIFPIPGPPGGIPLPPTASVCSDFGQCCNQCAGAGLPAYNIDCPGQLCCNTCYTPLPLPPNPYIALRTTVPPTIDGNISEFANANAITLTDPVTGARGVYSALWDASALYIAGYITDADLQVDTFVDEGDLFDEDSIEMSFDPQNNDGSSLGADDYKFFVNANENKTDTQRFTKSFDSGFTAKVILNGTLNDSNPDTSYTLEIRIPWGSWAAAPVNDDYFGWGLSMNDLHSGVHEKIDWLGAPINTPDAWGHMVFSGALVSGGSSVDNAAPVVTAFSLAQGSVKISWKVSDEVSGSKLDKVEVFRALSNAGPWSLIGTVDLSSLNYYYHDNTANPYIDKTVVPGTTYWYGIHVFDKADNYSDESDSGKGPLSIVAGSSGPTGVGLLGGTDFENTILGTSWQNVGGDGAGSAQNGAYKTITDAGLDDLPGINMKAWTFTEKTPASTVDLYHDFSICTPPGGSTKWMCAKNLDKDYPNRFVVTTDGSNTGSTYDEFFMEFDFILDSTFLNDFEDQTGAGGGWLSLSTLVDGQHFPAVIRLFSGPAANDGARWAIGMGDYIVDYRDQVYVVGTRSGGAPPDPLNQNAQHYGVSNIPIVGDTPTNVKFYYRLGDTSGGEIKLWIDDVLAVHITGDTGQAGGADNYNFMKLYGSWSDSSPEVSQIGYYDNFYIYNTYNESAPPPPPPGGTGDYVGMGLGSERGVDLHFSTGFESTGPSPVTHTGPVHDDGNWYAWHMDGADVGSYDFCSNMIGAADNEDCWIRSLFPYHNICNDTYPNIDDYWDVGIMDMTGPLEISSKVLKIYNKKYYFYNPKCPEPGGTASRYQWTVQPTGSTAPDNLKEYYIEYDVYLDHNIRDSLISGEDENWMFWEHMIGSDNIHLMIGNVVSINGDTPFFRLENRQLGAAFCPGNGYCNNTTFNIPWDTWATFGIYFKHATDSSGRMYFWVNDELIFGLDKATDENSVIGALCAIKSYVYDNGGYTHYIDNFEIYRTIQ
jgi:hypothetical protein